MSEDIPRLQIQHTTLENYDKSELRIWKRTDLKNYSKHDLQIWKRNTEKSIQLKSHITEIQETNGQ